MSNSDIAAFIKKYTLTPDNMGGSLDNRNNYNGADCSDWIGIISRARDSDLLTESNFETALHTLGGEKPNKISIKRIGHWACGWIEYLAVHKNYKAGIVKAMAIQASLEEYAVLDEDDYNDRESEAINDTFNVYKQTFINNAIICLQSKTDVPVTILESLNTVPEFEQLVCDAYHYDCGYRGYDDGFVTETNFIKALLNYYALLSCYGVNGGPNETYTAIIESLGV